MDFAVSEKMRSLLEQIREFIQSDLGPLERVFLSGGYPAVAPLLEEKRRRIRALGLWAPQIPKTLGGLGLTLLEHALVSQELGQSPLGHYVFNCQAPDAGNMELLIEFGNEEQQSLYLRPLVQGEIRSCFSMTEPDYPGSNPTWMGTTAVKQGDDYVINGRKWFTSAAEGAAFAIVMAITDPDAEPHSRASQIIVPCATAGFELLRNIPVMGDTGSGPFSHGEVLYRDCRVPQSNRLGPEGAGFRLAQSRLGPGRIHHCMRWIGVCERAFDLMCRRAASRELSPGDLLGTRQSVQEWIAQSRAEIDASRWAVLHAAWKIDTVGIRDAREEISLIKFHVAGTMMNVLDRAIQTHGALGVTDETLLSYFYRHERSARIYDGPDEVHKMVAARSILKRYGMRPTTATGARRDSRGH